MKIIYVISLLASIATVGCKTVDAGFFGETEQGTERSDISKLVWGDYPLESVYYSDKEADGTKVIASRLVIMPSFDVIVDQGIERTIRGRLCYREFTQEKLDFSEAEEALGRVEYALRQIPVLKDLNLAEYISEAVGFRVEGERYIAFNFVDKACGRILSNRMTIVHEGGPNFFQLSYNLNEEKIVRLKMNGYF
jgi:hypothetical protein